MAVAVSRTPRGIPLLRLEGDFDLNNVIEVESAFDSAFAEEQDVIVDLSAVAFLDSMLLRQIAHAHERAQGLGRRLVLVRPDPVLWRIFNVTGLARIIPAAGSVAEAEERLAAGVDAVPDSSP